MACFHVDGGMPSYPACQEPLGGAMKTAGKSLFLKKARSKDRGTRLQACVLVLGGLAVAIAAYSAVPPSPTTKGFVVTRFVPAYYEGPTGRTISWDKSDGQ